MDVAGQPSDIYATFGTDTANVQRMASAVFEKCVVGEGRGGFATMNIGRAVDGLAKAVKSPSGFGEHDLRNLL